MIDETNPLAAELVTDLIRSAWVVEAARARSYEVWSRWENRYSDSASRAQDRADMVAKVLRERGREPDGDYVEPHSQWMLGLVSEDPREIVLSNLFMARLGDWVDAHAGPFLGETRDRFEKIGEEEREALVFPDTLPIPPPYEPIEEIAVEAPGDVLFSFGILADLHFGSAKGEVMARAAIADLNASGVDLVIQLGDITDHGDVAEFELAAKVLSELEVPLTTMMGNHDVYSVKEERLSGREYYPEWFGREPDGVLLEHKGFRFAVLDSAEYGASPFAPFDLVTGTFIEGPGGAVVRGSFTDPQHDILADVASPGSPPAFVFLHHPPQPFTSFPPVIFGLKDVDSGRLHATVDSGNVWGVFAGHTHRNARPRSYGDVPVVEVGIPRDYPFGFAVVDVTSDGYAYRFVQLSNEELVRKSSERTGIIQRRYGLGPPEARAYAWSKSDKRD